MFVMPALFSLIFGGISVNSGNNKPIVDVVVNKGEGSQEIVNLLKKNDHFEWKKNRKAGEKKCF